MEDHQEEGWHDHGVPALGFSTTWGGGFKMSQKRCLVIHQRHLAWSFCWEMPWVHCSASALDGHGWIRPQEEADEQETSCRSIYCWVSQQIKKKKKKVDAKVDAKIVVVCFQRRLRKHLFGVSELKVSVINWFLNILWGECILEQLDWPATAA